MTTAETPDERGETAGRSDGTRGRRDGSTDGLDRSPIEPPVPPMGGLVLAVLAISAGAILVRLSSEAPSVVAFYRVLFTTLPLLPIAAWKHRTDFRQLTGRELGGAVLAGIALAIHFASWFESLDWTSVAASVTLVQSQPIFVAAGAWLLLDDRLTRRMVLGIALAVVGMATMSTGDLISGALIGPDPWYGNALAMIGAVMAAGYVLAGRSLRRRVALVPYVVIVYGVCALTLLLVMLAQGHQLTGYPTHEWLIFAGLALGPGLFGHTVINWALAHVESSVVSVSMLGEPIGATILALFVLAEVPTRFTVIGGAIVLAGIYLTASDREPVGDSSRLEMDA